MESHETFISFFSEEKSSENGAVSFVSVALLYGMVRVTMRLSSDFFRETVAEFWMMPLKGLKFVLSHGVVFV